jgi:hypothetical protein
MPPYSRRRFLKDSSIAMMTIGNGTFLLTGCESSPTGVRQDPTVGIWEMVSPVPVSAWTAALLPTGKVILFRDREQCFLWDPETREFGERITANTDVYCAGMALLGDGSVLAAGPATTLEIFRPWYTLGNNRPVINQWTREVGYGDEFSLIPDDTTDIRKVVIIRSSSVTHSLNTDQRYLELEFTVEDHNNLIVEAPESSGIAPPGYYLVFVVDSNNVPSKGEFMRITH